MNNLSSYCGLVDAKISASDKDLPVLLTVCTAVKSKGKSSQNFVAFSEYMNFNIRFLKANSITSRFLKPMTNIASSLPSTATRSQFFDGQTLLLLTRTQLEPASQITIMSSGAGQE